MPGPNERGCLLGNHPLAGRDFSRSDVLVLERPGVGDLRRLGDDRAAIKAALHCAYPRTGAGTIQQWAGTLTRFAFIASTGELIIHPDPLRRTLSIGRLHGEYFWCDEAPDQLCRKVRWVRTGVPRDHFSSAAQQAASGRAAFFSVRRSVEEFARPAPRPTATVDG